MQRIQSQRLLEQADVVHVEQLQGAHGYSHVSKNIPPNATGPTCSGSNRQYQLSCLYQQDAFQRFHSWQLQSGSGRIL